MNGNDDCVDTLNVKTSGGVEGITGHEFDITDKDLI